MLKSKTKKQEVRELNLLPIMTLFAILIAFLLTVAQFEKLGILELNLPERNEMEQQQTKKHDVDDNLLNLTVIVTDDFITIGAAGGFQPNVYYQEEVEYRSKSDGHVFRKVWGGEDEVVKSPTDGKVMTAAERETIFLNHLTKQDTADPGQFTFVAVDTYGDVLLTPAGEWYTNIPKPGESYMYIGDEEPKRMDVVTAQNCKLEKLSAYHEISRTLAMVHSKYGQLEEIPKDLDDVVVLAEPHVIYDKVIQLMDAAKLAGYDRVALSLLGGGEG